MTSGLTNKHTLDTAPNTSIALIVVEGITADSQKSFPFLSLHARRILRNAVFMIITKKVQKTVNKKKQNLVRKVHVSRLRIARGRFHGNHDIAQQIWLDTRPLSFSHGEGDDVRRAVTMQILVVDRRDFVIIHKNQTDFPFPAVKNGDGLIEDRSYFSQIQGDFLLLFGDDYGHYVKPLSRPFLLPVPVPGRRCGGENWPSVS